MQDFFDRIYIINLAHRTDRWSEMRGQLDEIGISTSHPNAQRFDAVRPSDAGPFQSIGARGCFMSHLGVLEHAVQFGYQRILILEDDLDFSKGFVRQWEDVARMLKTMQWQIFYGTYELPKDQTLNILPPLFAAQAEVPVGTTPFVAFQGEAIAESMHYLRDMLQREAGSPEGGPMHVDGAYSWLRRARPAWVTLLAHPQLGHQRPSRTDIHALPWYDQTTGLRALAQVARGVKRRFMGRK